MPHHDRPRLFDRHAARRTGGWRRLSAWAALFALLFNLAGTFAVPATAASVDDALHVLCTAGGMVPLASDGAGVPATAAAGVSCVFCLPLLHGDAAPALAPAPERPVLSHAVAFPRDRHIQAPPRRFASPASPRAPPV